jgi:hypothetical protein
VAEPRSEQFFRTSSQDVAGEMAEWLKAHAWKACLLERVTWVRVPLSPPNYSKKGVTRIPSPLTGSLFVFGMSDMQLCNVQVRAVRD